MVKGLKSKPDSETTVAVFTNKRFEHDGNIISGMPLTGKFLEEVTNMVEAFGPNKTKLVLLEKSDVDKLKVGNMSGTPSLDMLKKCAKEQYKKDDLADSDFASFLLGCNVLKDHDKGTKFEG